MPYITQIKERAAALGLEVVWLRVNQCWAVRLRLGPDPLWWPIEALKPNLSEVRDFLSDFERR